MDITAAPVRRVPVQVGLLGLALLVTLAAGVGTAIWLDPVPFSDWEYYWRAASDLSRYERGGALMLVLGLFKVAGLSPAATAVLFNLPFVAGVLWCAWRVDRTRHGVFALFVALGCILLAPYLALVQLDFSASVLLAIGLVLLLGSHDGLRGSVVTRRVAALVLIAVACSTRPQFVLILPVFAGLVWLAAFVLSRRVPDAGLTWAAVVLVAGSVAGFALDSGLRAYADRSAAVRYSSGVTLYAGLLASGTSQGCGRWSPDATNMARADMDRPVLEAVAYRLSSKPARHWLSVKRCKLPHIVRPESFAMSWVLVSPNVAERLEQQPQSRTTWLAWRIHRGLDRLWMSFVLVCYAFVIWLALQPRVPALWRWVPPAWLVSFWSVHLVFEIQGRYFLGTFLILPLLAALAWKARAHTAEPVRIDQG